MSFTLRIIAHIFIIFFNSKVSTQKMEEFKDELSIFAESFNMHGPGAVGDNLEKGTHAEKSFVNWW